VNALAVYVVHFAKVQTGLATSMGQVEKGCSRFCVAAQEGWVLPCEGFNKALMSTAAGRRRLWPQAMSHMLSAGADISM
jgi:hypothetical protein